MILEDREAKLKAAEAAIHEKFEAAKAAGDAAAMWALTIQWQDRKLWI